MAIRRPAPAPEAPAPGAPVSPSVRLVPGPLQAARELLTIRDCLRYACTRFEAAGVAYGQGTDNAWDEAVWLLLWCLHLPPDRLDPFLDARLTSRERRLVLELIDRRCRERVPSAYLTGEAWLRGLRFRADPRALVPRSLIAEAIEESLDDWLPEEGPAAVLDLCTGGGSIAVFAAHRFPSAEIDAADLSADALALAAENVALHGLQARIRLLQGDLFGPVADRRYGLILCNPPYVNAGSMAALPPEFLAEPSRALAGGVDGMDLVRRILAQAPAHLEPGGLLLLEIGHEARHFEAAFPALEFAYLPVTAGDDQLVLASREQIERAGLAAGTAAAPRRGRTRQEPR
jgi:ribosomal protein L3 glutamine methyltransferase